MGQSGCLISEKKDNGEKFIVNIFLEGNKWEMLEIIFWPWFWAHANISIAFFFKWDGFFWYTSGNSSKEVMSNTILRQN